MIETERVRISPGEWWLQWWACMYVQKTVGEHSTWGNSKLGHRYYFLLIGGWVPNLQEAHLGQSKAVTADFLERRSQRLRWELKLGVLRRSREGAAHSAAQGLTSLPESTHLALCCGLGNDFGETWPFPRCPFRASLLPPSAPCPFPWKCTRERHPSMRYLFLNQESWNIGNSENPNS